MEDREFFRVFDERLNRPACLRRIPPTVSMREYEVIARLNHRNILAIYHVRREDLLTEAVSGSRLSDFLSIPGDRRAFTTRFQEMLVGPLIRAVNYAHEHGVIHGFLHPGNVWLFPHDELKVWGFGFTRLEAGSSDTGWQFASPEVRRGERPSRRSDIWSVGALMHLLICGRPPGDALESSLPGWVLGCLDGRYSTLWEVLEQLFPLHDPPLTPPNESLLHTTLANNYFRQQKLELAVLEWEKALAVYPGDQVARNNLGVVFWRWGRVEEAEACFEQAGSHFNLGLLFLEQRKFEEALQALNLAILMRPSLAAAYLALGESLLAQGKAQEAIEEFHKALILNIQWARTYRSLATAYDRLGKPHDAQSYREKSLEVEDQQLELVPIILETPLA